MLVPVILLCICVICLSAPPSTPAHWAALILAIVALLAAVVGWPTFR